MGLFLLFLLLELTTKTMDREKNITFCRWGVEPQRNFKVVDALSYHSLVQLPSKAILLFLQLLISLPTLSHPWCWHRCMCGFTVHSVVGELMQLKNKPAPSGLFFSRISFPFLFHLIAVEELLLAQRRS